MSRIYIALDISSIKLIAFRIYVIKFSATVKITFIHIGTNILNVQHKSNHNNKLTVN